MTQAILYHTDTGQGDPLVLLHSGGMNHQEWTPQLAHLNPFYRVICPDQPGHGQSPMLSHKLRIKDCAQAVVALLDHLHIQRAHICGSSMGGATALWIARHMPERVSSLCLYRVNYHKNEATHRETYSMARPEYWQKMGLTAYLSKLHLAQGGELAWQQVIARVAEALDPKDSDHDHTLDDLTQINQPVLLVCGDRDPLVPISDLLDMHNHFPHSALWLMPYASHITASNTWRADMFALELRRFLLRVSKEMR